MHPLTFLIAFYSSTLLLLSISCFRSTTREQSSFYRISSSSIFVLFTEMFCWCYHRASGICATCYQYNGLDHTRVTFNSTENLLPISSVRNYLRTDRVWSKISRNFGFCCWYPNTVLTTQLLKPETWTPQSTSMDRTMRWSSANNSTFTYLSIEFRLFFPTSSLSHQCNVSVYVKKDKWQAKPLSDTLTDHCLLRFFKLLFRVFLPHLTGFEKF